MLNQHLIKITQQAICKIGAKKEDSDLLINCNIEELMFCANKVRHTFFENKVSLCAIVNAKSGKCSENCSFCAQSSHHATSVKEYPLLKKEELIAKAKQAQKSGAHCFGIVTSGDTVREEELAEVVEAVKYIVGEMKYRCSASLGMLEQKDFLHLKNAGLSLYHHNLETSENFFPKICTTHTWQERFKTIESAKKIRSIDLFRWAFWAW